MRIKYTVPEDLVKVAKEFGVPDKNLGALFQEYIDMMLSDYYSPDVDSFRQWCQEDGVDEYLPK